jgi:hypothetical protein
MQAYQWKAECWRQYAVVSIGGVVQRMVNAQVIHPTVAVPVSKEADETSRYASERIDRDS